MDPQRWGESEYHRLALLTLACKQTGADSTARNHWSRITNLAERRLPQLTHLLRLTAAWKWEVETEELLWLAVNNHPSEKWAFGLLNEYLFSKGRTKALHKLYARLTEIEPTNSIAMNNLVMLDLLQPAPTTNTFLKARALYEQSPTNATLASTYGFALLVQGKPLEAARLFESLPPHELKQPGVAVYYGVALASANPAKAPQYLAMADKARLLPEEKLLVTTAWQRTGRK